MTCRPSSPLARVGLSVAVGAWLLVGGSAADAAPLLGITQNGDIYASDPVAGTDTLIYASGRTFSNGLAYDAVNNRIFYVDGTGGAGGQGPEFYVYDVATGVESRIDINGPSNSGFGSLTGTAESGSIYNGAYWYIQEGQDSLFRVQLDFSTPTSPVVSNITEFNDFDDVGGPERLSAFNGGDISIDNSGVLFLTSHADQYGRVTLSGTPGTPGAYTQVATGSSLDGVQLAHDLSTGVLYGHSYSSGTWYTVNQTTGALTSTGYTSPNHFFDTASGPFVFVPEPSVVALLGIAGVSCGCWFWRKRRQKAAAA